MAKRKRLTAQEIDEVRKKEFYIIVDENLQVNVKVVDYKSVFGRNRFLVTPISGRGETWKNAEAVLERQQVKENAT